MFDSLRAVLRAFPAIDSAWVTPVDVPPVPTAVLDAFEAARSAVPTHKGRAGHPVLLAGNELQRARDVDVEGGLRSLLRDVPRVEVGWESVDVDFDDPPSWRSFVGSRVEV